MPCFSPCFTHRGPEIIPPWAPRAINDHWTLWWMDSGLQVSCYSPIKDMFVLCYWQWWKIISSSTEARKCNCQNEKWWHLIRSGAQINYTFFHSIQDMDKRLQALMSVCEKLPTDNLNNFRSVALSDFLPIHYVLLPSMCISCTSGTVVDINQSKLSLNSIIQMESLWCRYSPENFSLTSCQLLKREITAAASLAADMQMSPSTAQKMYYFCSAGSCAI